MRKLWSVAISLSLVLSSVFMLASAAGAESGFEIVEDAGISERVQAFADIKAMFTDDTDLQAVKQFYIDHFQTEVQRIDVTIKADAPKIDENITFVLDHAIEGTLNAGQAKQAVDKGIQWYFYFAMRDLISNNIRPALTEEDYDTAKTAFDKVVQIYEGAIQGTVAKRDATFGLDMVGILQGTIEQLQADLAEHNADDFNVHRQVLDKTIIKTYALATLTYATNIPTKPVADQPAAMTEGYFLFLPVYTYLKGGSADDANYILEIFASGDAGKVDKDKIQDALQRTMIGKVSEYVTNALAKLAAGDLQGARGYAMEGNMFLSTQETFFTKEEYNEASTFAQQFADAVNRSDLSTAQSASFQMLQYLVVKDGIEIRVGENDYSVDGQLRTSTVAPYVNAKTNRTLVPVRLIAEAINADVEYENETATVTIIKDGKTTELKVGSDTIIQDGKQNEEFKLDQPVVEENGRSFIPLRAVAELFGKRVFYSNNGIIILR